MFNYLGSPKILRSIVYICRKAYTYTFINYELHNNSNAGSPKSRVFLATIPELLCTFNNKHPQQPTPPTAKLNQGDGEALGRLPLHSY